MNFSQSAQAATSPTVADAPAVPIDPDQARWQALLGRRAAGASKSAAHFFYGVTSTGIVCRQGCPSRLPQRKNVRFFDTLAQALQSDFRPCLRCRPDGISPQQEALGRIQKVVDAIEAGLEQGEAVQLKSLAQIAGLSPFRLHRAFRAAVGVMPARYAQQVRRERFRSQLSATAHVAVTEAIYAAGFQSASPAYGEQASLGMTPDAFRHKGMGAAIRYSVAESPLGRMLVAATSQGVCNIAFADTEEALLAELQQRFASADLQRDDDALGGAIAAVLRQLQEPASALDLPLHVRATAFQQRVWHMLRTVPVGETRTYAEVAKAIGQSTAARAVARACASNPVAVAVPCHRVVGCSGGLTGFRWGLERKRRLLNLERQCVGTDVSPGS